MNLFKEILHKKNVYYIVLILVIVVAFGFLILQRRNVVEGFSYNIQSQLILRPVSGSINSYTRAGSFKGRSNLQWMAGPTTMPDSIFTPIQEIYTKYELYDRMLEYPSDYVRVDTYTLIPYAAPNNVLGCEREWELKTIPDMGSLKYFTTKPDWIIKNMRSKCNVEITPQYLSTFPPKLQEVYSNFIVNEQRSIIREKRQLIRDLKRVVSNCAARRKDADGMFAPALRNAYEAQKEKNKNDLQIATLENIKKDATTTLGDIAKETGITTANILNDPAVRTGLKVKVTSGTLKAAAVNQLRPSPYAVVNTALKSAGLDLVKGAMEGLLKVLTGDPFAGTECPVGFTEINQINTDPTFQKINEIFPNPFADFINLGATTKACAKYEPGKAPEIKQKICDDKYVLDPEPMKAAVKPSQASLDATAATQKAFADTAKKAMDAAAAKQKKSPGFGNQIAALIASTNYKIADAKAVASKKAADDNRSAETSVCEMDKDITKKLQLISDWLTNYTIANSESVKVIQNFKAIWVPNEYLLEAVFQVANYSKSAEYAVRDKKLFSNESVLSEAKFYFSKSGCTYSVFGYYYTNLDFKYQFKVDIQREVNFSPQTSDMFLLWQYAMEEKNSNPVEYAKTNSTNKVQIDSVKKIFAERAAKEEAERKERADLLSYLNPKNNETISFALKDSNNIELKERKEIFEKYKYDTTVAINHLPIERLREKVKGEEKKVDLIKLFNPSNNVVLQAFLSALSLVDLEERKVNKSVRDSYITYLNTTNDPAKQIELEKLSTTELNKQYSDRRLKLFYATTFNPSNNPQTATILDQLDMTELNNRYQKWKDRKDAIKYFNPSDNDSILTRLLEVPAAELNERMTLIKSLNPKTNEEIQSLNLLTLDALRLRVDPDYVERQSLISFFGATDSFTRNKFNEFTIVELRNRKVLIEKMKQGNDLSVRKFWLDKTIPIADLEAQVKKDQCNPPVGNDCWAPIHMRRNCPC